MKTDIAELVKYYYYIKPFMPRRLQLMVRSWVAVRKRRSCKDIWPIDREAAQRPDGWHGWPDNKKFALVLTHDVDTCKGHEKCSDLVHLEEEMGFRSSYNFVASEYRVSPELLSHVTDRGYEVGVHGLFHNRTLYESKTAFKEQAIRINSFMRDWQAVGFRSPCMYHNLDWLQFLDIEYDASTFDTDPFEPQSDSVRTIYPFWVAGKEGRKGYVELPYTLPQDFTLFVLMKEKNINVWKEKIDWIAESGGMALLNTHPDYMNFGNEVKSCEEYPVQLYQDFLTYINTEYGGRYWHVLPKEMARFWVSHQHRNVREEQSNILPTGITPETGNHYGT